MEVIKPGISDTLQDTGRYGYAHLGIGAGGCMDVLAGTLANALAGNRPETAVLEMHFPAPVLFFPEPCVLALSGADFGAVSNGFSLPLNRRILLPAGSTLSFTAKKWGQRCYLAIAGGWQVEPVMNSFSTHLKAGFGGWKGRALQKGDFIPLQKPGGHINLQLPEVSGWFVVPDAAYRPGPVRVVAGPEWDWLSYIGKKQLLNQSFSIGKKSDRMGYQFEGQPVEGEQTGEMLSSGVLPGTIQLLPDGGILLLMADCQTTGGYPRILQVAAVDLPKLAQAGAGETIYFSMIGMDEAIGLFTAFRAEMNSLLSAIALSIK